jgi:hypothetical protein
MTFKDFQDNAGMTIEQVLEIDPLGTTYTFVSKDDGQAVHIASGCLARFLKDMVGVIPTYEIELDPTVIAAMQRGDLGIEEDHALKLPEEALEAPLIVCEWGGTHIFADGAHRLWRRWKRGDTTFTAWVVPERVWRHFVVMGLPGTGDYWDDFNRNAKVRGGLTADTLIRYLELLASAPREAS